MVLKEVTISMLTFISSFSNSIKVIMYIFLNRIDKKCSGIKYLILDMSPFKKDFYIGLCFSKVLSELAR